MAVSRYFAQHVDVDPVFLSRHGTGWQVFDRDRTGRQGDVEPIALCVSRTQAFRIRDALNVEDKLKKGSGT